MLAIANIVTNIKKYHDYSYVKYFGQTPIPVYPDIILAELLQFVSIILMLIPFIFRLPNYITAILSYICRISARASTCSIFSASTTSIISAIFIVISYNGARMSLSSYILCITNTACNPITGMRIFAVELFSTNGASCYACFFIAR